jgi:hypothetical protein
MAKKGLSMQAAEAAVRKLQGTDLPEAVRLVQEWSRDAKGPAPSDTEAEPLARLVLGALASPSWRQEFDAGREHDADLARERRVAAAIKILQVDLPRYIERWRSEDLPVELSRTLALQKLAYEHQPLIDAVPQLHERKPGRVPSREVEVRNALAERYLALTGAKRKAVDAFTARAMDWILDRPVRASEGAIGRARRRRT